MRKNQQPMTTRRSFIKKATVGTAAVSLSGLVFPQTASAYTNILGSNEQINVAVIGVRSRGKAHCSAINAYPNAKIIYSCDVDDTILDEHNAWCEKNIGYVPKVEKDFRKVLEDKDVDAVFIATPDHLHAPIAIWALQAGKHVYVEKPCSHNPHENDLLVATQKKYGHKVQMGKTVAAYLYARIHTWVYFIIQFQYKVCVHFIRSHKRIGRIAHCSSYNNPINNSIYGLSAFLGPTI